MPTDLASKLGLENKAPVLPAEGTVPKMSVLKKNIQKSFNL